MKKRNASNYKITLAIFLLFFSVCIIDNRLIAQDFHLSQYDAPPLNLNPAMTGMFDAAYRIHLHYRSQWAAVATKPFTTAGLSFDMPLRKFGIGGQIMNFRAGAGGYNALSIMLSGAYNLVFDKAQNHHLALGIQAGMIQKSVNVDKLTFGNQYSNSGGFDAGLPSGEVFSNTNFVLANFNAGLIYYYAKEGVRLNPFIGFSAANITQPNETFFGETNRLPIRYNIHGGTKINVNEVVQLLPKFLYMKQTNASEFTVSLLVHYYLQGSESYLIFGPTYRKDDAAIAEIGLKKGKYTCRISYDFNTSSLKTVSNYRGGLEVSFTYIPTKSKPNPFANCPRL